MNSKSLKHKVHHSFKAELREAALELFSARGFNKVTLRDLAFAVQIPEQAITRHYRAKEAILLDGIGENGPAFHQTLMAQPRSARPIDAFRAAIATQIQPLISLECLLAITIYSEQSPELRRLFSERRQHWQAALANAIADWLGCLEQTDFRPQFWAGAMLAAILFTIKAEAKDAGVQAVFDNPDGLLDLAFGHLGAAMTPQQRGSAMETPARRSVAT